MAQSKNERNRKGDPFFEVTKERPATSFEMVLVSGSIGATLAFFITLVFGAWSSTVTLDGLLLTALVVCILGFGLGLFIGWLIVKYFSDLLDGVVGGPSETASAVEIAVPTPVVSSETAIGKSVDYVFPEFSPDQR